MKNKKQFQEVWTLYKDEYVKDGLELLEVKELFLPFWKCQQEIVVEKEQALDPFSRVLLSLVEQGVQEHQDIVEHLGLQENSFALTQLFFLIQKDLLRALPFGKYVLTPQGKAFLNEEICINTLEKIVFDYVLMDPMGTGRKQKKGHYLNLKDAIDRVITGQPKASFEQYILRPSYQLWESGLKIPAERGQQPNFAKIREQKNDFITYLNQCFPHLSFYDFANTSLKSTLQYIAFLGLVYADNKRTTRHLDVRQYQRSVKGFQHYEKEMQLSLKAPYILSMFP